ncbi:Type I restriction-modification system, DNA methylase subunit, partial [Candidatus Methanophagaceae archaeon]
ETQVRREFIDPFFDALDWDVSNKQGYAEQYKEVVHEDTIKVGRSTRAPDYSFRVGGQRKFFVEAKKPAVNIKEDISPSYQLRRYAWSAKLPLSIVTDFEELSVFNCQIKPNPTDKPSIGRIAYYTFDEYLDKFDEIYDIFSKEAILKGSFDRYAQSTKGKKGTAEVDREFLKEIESWRELLAKNIALRNPDVSIYELNYAVQKIIDRIIFLRICEDRGIEHYEQLQTRAEGDTVYTHLLNHFKLAESKYNSGIFDFDTDVITPSLHIDDKVLKTIILDLYYPKSPYEFSVLGVEILGNVYEQFLGKVIRLTAGHQAKVETKPEVKKAGGVYYTPQYIVEYIVKNTVGKLVEGKTPAEIAAIKILDPACGSGSFLIGAYSYLLRYHLDWYVSNKPKNHKEAVFQVRENEWYLTTAEKKRILLNNIFGVDIDSQAVEVTKMSLLLKVLEHESRESIDQQVKLGLEGVLPNLGGNIKCGNSLIGPYFYEQQQETLFDEAEMRRVNVFDWDDDVKGFGVIMRKGGFDCVIGNPPYGAFFGKPEKVYLLNHYKNSPSSLDSYLLFYERCLRDLLKKYGCLGFITPNTWELIFSAAQFRTFVLTNFCINEIVHFTRKIFKSATVDCEIVIVQNVKRQEHKVLVAVQSESKSIQHEIPQSLWLSPKSNPFNILLTEREHALLAKINSKSVHADNLFLIKNGVKPFEGGKGKPPQTREIVDTKPYVSEIKQDDTFRPLLRGGLIQRYVNFWTEDYWISYGPWLAAPRDPKIFEAPEKIVCRQTGDRIICTLIDNKFICRDNLHIILPQDCNYNLKYILGILNSSFCDFCYRAINPEKGEALAQIKKQHLGQLPVRTIDFSNPEEVAQHDKLVALVDNMLELQKKHRDARMEQDKELYGRQIKLVDAQIDRLVYDLYGLTEEEMKVVEG